MEGGLAAHASQETQGKVGRQGGSLWLTRKGSMTFNSYWMWDRAPVPEVVKNELETSFLGHWRRAFILGWSLRTF